MNRETRRRLMRLGVTFLVASRVCELCGGPYCPRCDVESELCEDCEGNHCPSCFAYVLAPVPNLH